MTCAHAITTRSEESRPLALAAITGRAYSVRSGSGRAAQARAFRAAVTSGGSAAAVTAVTAATFGPAGSSGASVTAFTAGHGSHSGHSGPGHSGTTGTACAVRSGHVDSDAAEGGAGEGGSNGRGGSCCQCPGRSQLRSRKRAFRERVAPAWRAMEARADGSATQRGNTCNGGHGRHGANHGQRRDHCPWSRRSRRRSRRHPWLSRRLSQRSLWRRAASGPGFRCCVGSRGSGFHHPISRPRGRELNPLP